MWKCLNKQISSDTPAVFKNIENFPNIRSLLDKFLLHFDQYLENDHSNSSGSPNKQNDLHNSGIDLDLITDFKIFLSNLRSYCIKLPQWHINLPEGRNGSFKSMFNLLDKFLSEFDYILKINTRPLLNIRPIILKWIIPPRQFFVDSSTSISKCYDYTCPLLSYIIFEYMRYHI